MRLYHGSNMAIEQPKLIHQSRGLDFGAGVYLTSSETQARRFSKIVCNRRRGMAAGVPTVSVYEFDFDATLRKLAVLRFDSADTDWLHFVLENRLKSYGGELYDVVTGAVANDDVMPTIQALMGGFLTEEAALVALKTKKLVDQFCLKSEAALGFLTFVNAYQVEEA